MNKSIEGLLLINKSRKSTSFSLVRLLRKVTKVQKIGHAGTLDPFAQGLMIMLIGKTYTKKSNLFLSQDKEYDAILHLGYITESFDPETPLQHCNDIIPSIEEVQHALKELSGEVLQTPPMYSAKKINGQKLYQLARQGKTVERAPVKVTITIKLTSYSYPFLSLNISCSKGTYIRSLANDIGEKLGCGAYLKELIRTRSGSFALQDSIEEDNITSIESISNHLIL